MIDVILPFYKSDKYKDRILNSLVGNRNLISSVILVNDGDVDDDLNVYHELKKNAFNVVRLKTRDNIGPGGARNLGLDYANADLIAFLDCDDIWDFGHLNILFNLLKSKRGDIAVASYRVATGRNVCTVIQPTTITYTRLLQTNTIATPGVILWKSSINRMRFLNEYHEDYKFWIALIKSDIKFVTSSQVTLTVVKEKNSVSSTYTRGFKEQVVVLTNEKVRGIRFVTFLFLYAFNAILKRLMKNYRPIYVYK